jgi:hypothetical protein
MHGSTVEKKEKRIQRTQTPVENKSMPLLLIARGRRIHVPYSLHGEGAPCDTVDSHCHVLPPSVDLTATME